ncbi:MAG: polysaccharide deacetylase family protein [Gammaproteobacteria bacterium]
MPFKLTPLKYFARAAVAALAFCGAPSWADSIAYTFDDGPTLDATPQLSPRQRNDALLAVLAKHQIKSVLFITSGNGTNRAEGYPLARAWGEAGHLVGNHTVTHPDLNAPAVTLAQYQQEVLDCDAAIRTLPNYRKWFRFTFLNDGNTPEKRDGMRSFLRQQHYRAAPVTFAVLDWEFNDKLIAALKADPKADVQPIRQAYLDTVRKNAQASLAKAPADRVHTILLHHNLVNAMWLEDVVTLLESMGFTSTPAAEVYAHLPD